MIRTNPFFKIIRKVFFLLILQLAFSACEPNDHVFEVKNQSDYNLSIVIKGMPIDSVKRLIFVYNFNEDFFNRPYSKLVDSAALGRLLTEFSDPNIFRNKLNYLIDSGYIFSFANGILPEEGYGRYSNPYVLSLKKSKKDILLDATNSYYKNISKPYFREMIVNNFFTIPLPKKSIFTLRDYNVKYGLSEFILNCLPRDFDIRIMYGNKIIKSINEKSIYRIDSGTRYFKGYKYSQIKIGNKDVEKVLKIKSKS